MPTTTTSSGPMATAARALQLARDLTEVAARLRECSAELLAATTPAELGAAIASPPPPVQTAAVARGARPRGQRAAKRTLAAGPTKTAQPAAIVTTAALMDLDAANEELRACARYGAWRPSPATRRSARSA